MSDSHDGVLRVFISDWQMQCCGGTFSINDSVEWTVASYSQTSLVTGAPVEFYYENHASKDQQVFKLTGVVIEIWALFYSYESRPAPSGLTVEKYLHPVFEKSLSITEATGWDESHDGFRFGAYEILLRDYTVT